MKATEPAVRHPAGDSTLADAGGRELRARQHPVLARGDRGQPAFLGKFQTLRAHNLPMFAGLGEESARFRRIGTVPERTRAAVERSGH
jgi:hypothetical protein